MLRIGILSTAKIARNFIAGCKGSGKINLVAVASRDAAKAQAFAAEHGIPIAHGSYEALLADSKVDAVYNPLPNGLHAEWNIKAAQAGKHVLSEKPFASNAQQAAHVFAIAARHGVTVLEAYPYLAQPQTIELRRRVVAGELGALQMLQTGFSFTLSRPNDVRLDAALAGGALMDLGCYTVSLALMLAGQAPLRVFADAQYRAPEQTQNDPIDPNKLRGGVDMAMSGSLEFASGLKAQFNVSFAAARSRYAVLVGTQGVVNTPFHNDTSSTLDSSFALRTDPALDGVVQSIANPTVDGFRAETEQFADLIASGATPQTRDWTLWTGATPELSMLIARTLDALALSAKTGQVVHC